MRLLDCTDLAKRRAGGRSGGARRGPRAAALLAITLLCCLFGPLAAPSAAAPAHDSAQALRARLALQQAELIAGAGAAEDVFGCSVAISADTALVGAQYQATAGKDEAGAAYIFTRSAGVWTQEAKLTAADGAAGDRFGCSVAISADTALVGAPLHDVAGRANAGAVYVFTRSGGAWTPRSRR